MNSSRYVEQITALISSPLVDQYLIGVTCNVESRRTSYKSTGFPFFFILDVGLERASAISLERELFNLLVCDKTSATYNKYHHEKRDGKYHPSTGGKKNSNNKYFIYIAAFGF